MGAPMQLWRGARTAALLLVLPVALPASPGVEGGQCEGGTIRVVGADDGDVTAVCEAVVTASSFFDSVGLRMPEVLVVRLVSAEEPDRLGESEIGRYDARRQEIVVRDYRNYRTVSPPASAGEAAHAAFASLAFWQSWIIHELTHAAVEAKCGRCLSTGLHEYMAAVAQLATLDEAVRAEVLAEYGEVEAFDQIPEVSGTYYAINPRYFIVKSYKHFSAQPDSIRFLRAFVSSLGKR